MGHADNNNNNSRSLFIDTNLDTHFAIIVSHSDTISDIRRKIMLEHQECFPSIGDIKIDSLKVQRSGRLYHLPDSMLVKSVFATVKDDWFLSVDASRLAQGVGIQQVEDNYKVGDQRQLALLCATDKCSQGSPSTHLTIVPVENLVVSSVNQFTTGNSDKDYRENTEENRPFDHDLNFKKRTLVQTESLVEDASGVEKKRKTEEKEANAKASEDLGGENIRTNNENSLENNIQDLNDESTRLNIGEKCSGLDQEATVGSSSIENKNTEASEIIVPDVFMVLEKNIEREISSEISQKEKGESPLVQNNSEANETAPAVLMVVEENIQQEIPSEISQKEKEIELVKERVTGNEIASSSMKTSDCKDGDSGKDKTAEKEVCSTSLIKTRQTLLKDAADMSEKDLGSTVQESAGDEIDNRKEDNESSRKQEPEVKLPRRKKKAKKSATRNKDESANSKDDSGKSKDELEKSKDELEKSKDEALMERADNIVSEISSIVPATAHGTKNDKVNLSNAENNEVLEKTLPDDVTMQEVEISKPSDVVEETSKEIKDAVRRRKKKKDVGRSTTRNDAATVTNEENVLPHSSREESQDITLIDALLVHDSITADILANNDAEVPRTEENVSKGNGEGIEKAENQNEKMNGETRKKRKNKSKESAKNVEGGMPTEISYPHANNHLNENAKEHETALLDAVRILGDEMKGREAQVFDAGLVTKAKKNTKSSVTGPEDLQSKCQSTELELQPEKSQSTNMTVPEVVKSKEIVNDEGNVSKEGSRDIDLLDYSTPGKDTTMFVKVKKPKKKKEQFFVNFRNDSSIQPHKLISKSENKKVPTNVVNDPHISNTDQFKTPRISISADANKAHGEPSAEVFRNQKSDRPRVILGLASVKTMPKNAPEVNMSQHAKTLLSLSGTIFEGDNEEGSADDNASPRKSSSSGDIASSIDSGSCAVKRKGDGGNSRSNSKNISMIERLRSSPRFKRAKVTTSQQPGETESEPVEFVPESPPMAQG